MVNRYIHKESENVYGTVRKESEEMAAIVGVSPPTFHNWLKGKKMPRMNNVQKLADYFGVKLSDLIE